MVDPNPARGMPAQLQRYWLAGKGAAKIRWGMPHDFNRCVRNLRKYFPKNPEGLCNILHQKALGAAPGKGHGHSIDEATALLAAMPQLGKYVWAGPIAPIGRPTGEPRRIRVFEHGSLTHRPLPLPLAYRKVSGEGHAGSVTVARMLGVGYGPDENGQDSAYAWGDWLSADIVPEVREAMYMVQQGIVGPSVDPGGRVVATLNPETGAEHTTQYVIGGATLVSIPAFAAMRLYTFDVDEDFPDDDPDMVMELDSESDCGCSFGVDSELASETAYAVNSSGWRGLPLAPRDSVFDNDDAIKRIAAWAASEGGGLDVSKMRRAFLWYDPQRPPADPTAYRLPVGDVINGKLTLIYHAIYAAAALLSGAHGGLPQIPEPDREELRATISAIYPEMAKEFNDSSIRAPWDRSAQPGVQLSITYASDDAKEPYGDVKYADPGYQEDGKKRYPIDTPDHVRAAWSYINQADNAGKYTPAQLKKIRARIKVAMKKIGAEVEEEYAMSDYPIDPPKAWFDNPRLQGKTPITVTPEGQVYGHLAAWGECHRDVTMRECVLAPKSRKEYAPFHLGSVYTAEGEEIRVGKIVMDTRHASINLGYTAAAVHYDNTGDEVAVVRAGEDEYGIWVAGAIVPEADRKKVAKLRRSPLSGDWRAVDGHLELTAALAVNFPAFPVYAMENEEVQALVAAGSIYPDAEEVEYVAEPEEPQQDEFDEDQEERAQALADLLEDDEIYDQRERAQALEGIFAADAAVATPFAPTPGASAAAAPVAPGAVAPASAAEGMLDEMGMMARQQDAAFSIVEEPAGDPSVGPGQATPAGTPAPAVPAPAQAPAPTPAPVG